MNKYGKAVLWMGLILMALQLAFRWAQIRSIIFAHNSAGGGGGGFNIPPFPTFPLTPITLGTPRHHNVSGNAAANQNFSGRGTGNRVL